jgi:phosphoribosylformylglycinamidine (FGAM) synthase-like enzyme
MENVLTTIVNGLAPILIALIGWGTAEAAKYIRAKTKDKDIDTVMTTLHSVVLGVVTDMQYTQVQALKDTGKFTEVIGANIKRMAISSVLRMFTPSLTKMANRYIGDLEAYISSVIETELVHVQENLAYIKKTTP